MTDNISILVKRGSATAIAGFQNEKDVVNKFNNWRQDLDAQNWLYIMGYDLEKIELIEAIQITGSHKADVQVKIKIYIKDLIAAENISIKLVSNPVGFNQIDKRKISKYVDMWAVPEDVAECLKYFTGEKEPYVRNTKDKRRMYLNEMGSDEQEKILNFFESNKIMILTDILKGTDKFAAGWMLIYLKSRKIWSFLPMSIVMNYYAEGEVRITKQGNLSIGRVGMQRKGGDGGRESAKMLQFKINPASIVNNT